MQPTQEICGDLSHIFPLIVTGQEQHGHAVLFKASLVKLITFSRQEEHRSAQKLNPKKLQVTAITF